MYEKNDRDFQKHDAEAHPGASASESEPDRLRVAADDDEVDEESLRALIGQFQGLDVDCDKYAVRFNVLCDYVLHEEASSQRSLVRSL